MQTLETLHQEILSCYDCSIGSPKCYGKATYRGNKNSKVFLIGECPGETEAEQGVPFVGWAGKKLDQLFQECIGVDTNQFYISNTCRCRPEKNRKPTKQEQDICSKFWKAEIDLIDPALIIAVGSYAVKALGIRENPIMRDLAGKIESYEPFPDAKWHDGEERPVLVLYHPAAIAYANGKEIEAKFRQHLVQKSWGNETNEEIIKSALLGATIFS